MRGIQVFVFLHGFALLPFGQDVQLQLLKVVRYSDGASARGLAALRSDRGPYTCVDGGGTEAFGCSLGVVVAMLLSVRV